MSKEIKQDELRQKLWQLRCLLDEIQRKAEPLSKALCLYGKGDAIYNHLQMLEVRDAVDAYKRLNEDQQRWFYKAINKTSS